MVFIPRQELFTCGHCGARVEPLPEGSYRNHCPRCLWSRHVDDVGPGDRASHCGALMEPVLLDYRSSGVSSVTHRCVACGKTIRNLVAPDDDLHDLAAHLAAGQQ